MHAFKDRTQTLTTWSEDSARLWHNFGVPRLFWWIITWHAVTKDTFGEFIQVKVAGSVVGLSRGTIRYFSTLKWNDMCLLLPQLLNADLIHTTGYSNMKSLCVPAPSESTPRGSNNSYEQARGHNRCLSPHISACKQKIITRRGRATELYLWVDNQDPYKSKWSEEMIHIYWKNVEQKYCTAYQMKHVKAGQNEF